MPYFLQIFKDGGGQVEIRQVNDIKRELRDTFDIVVNCTGLQAGRVVRDSSVHPKRGQIMRVRFYLLLQDNKFLPCIRCSYIIMQAKSLTFAKKL